MTTDERLNRLAEKHEAISLATWRELRRTTSSGWKAAKIEL
jgi:hypothetical protein